MLDALRELFTSMGADGFEQAQSEAILTMLVWVMRADGKLQPAESDKLGQFAHSIRWTSPLTMKEYVLGEVERIKQLERGELKEADLMAEIAQKLQGKDVRYKAIKCCHELAKADNYLHRAEVGLLHRFTDALL